MLDRRNVLKSGTAGAILAFAGAPLARAAATMPAAAPGAGDALNKLFDTFMDEALTRSPEFTTTLGLDTGARASEKGKLDERSLAAVASDKERNTSQLKRLEALGRKGLSGTDAIGYDVVHYSLATTERANHRYNYGAGGAGIPYIVSQFGGAYQTIPDFLDSQHSIATKEDADSYLARLEAFATALDQEDEVIRHDAGLGVSPPDFVLTRTLNLMTALRAPAPEQSVLSMSVARRTKEKNILGDYGAQAAAIVTQKVYSALDRQMTLFKSMQPHATHEAGVWRLPRGRDYYTDALANWATTDMSPAKIHQLGLKVVKDHTARIDAIMKSQGLTRGTVGQRLHAMYLDPKFQYPNTDEGKEKLLADLNLKVQKIRAELPKYFGTLPKADVIIKRVPKYIEEGQAGGYYQAPSLDETRPGFYYINLRNTAEVPSWTLPTLTYHESIPGHHLQGSLQQEASLPLIRKVAFFSAYLEGWALYAEQFADEIGMYADDPWGRIGYLHDAMFRGVRLVVDTGLHAMKWPREKAIKYYMDMLGDPEASVATEVERYCVWPGQACSYMIGKLTILRLRDRAKAALRSRFDIREFHDAILLCGAVPLSILESIVDNWIAAKKRA